MLGKATGNWREMGLAAMLVALVSVAPALLVYDIAEKSDVGGDLLRLYGNDGLGTFGVPLGAGFDVDGDGFEDVALALMTASPLGRNRAGEIVVLFGAGTGAGAYDAGVPNPNLLHIYGAAPNETAGSEVWIHDVTGDGLGDILICRQNHTPVAGRTGAGAFTIIKGGPELRARAAAGLPIDLANIPPEITALTLVGANAYDRMGMWSRAGDITGDGIADLAVGADQISGDSGIHSGALFVIRGGEHLAVSATVDLAQFGSTILEGHLVRITPPLNSMEFHFGSTNYVADLDGNGRAEVLVSAALSRAGAGLLADGAPTGSAHSSGGAQGPDRLTFGRVYILWDDNFPPGEWPARWDFRFDLSPGTRSVLSGARPTNRIFGEELAAGVDFDMDGNADLFVGDFLADGTGGSRSGSGIGYVFYHAALLKGRTISLGSPLPPDIRVTRILGTNSGAISSDTVAIGDFDGDGADDLAVGSPHANPVGRTRAGVVHILHGQRGGWPELIDSAPGNLPPTSVVRIVEIRGAKGQDGTDRGDVLCYSAAAGDMDGDGKTDLVVNEMTGNGLQPGTVDVGNLLVIRGESLPLPEGPERWGIK